jgi:hypothetical protein
MGHSIKSLSAKRTIGIAVGVAAILGTAGGALAASGSAATPSALTASASAAAAATSGPVIAGCIVGNSRTLENVHAAASNLPRCPDGQFRLTWNQAGPKGATGAVGPKGVAGPTGPQGPAGTVSSPETNLVSSAENVVTGGSFTARKTLVGTVTLKAGTYLINVNFTATPDAVTGGQVFPFVAVYNGVQANGSFANDLFNVGAGALEQETTLLSPGDSINSNFSGSSQIQVLNGTETLDFYAFGNDSDLGEGSYTLNALNVIATQLNVGTGGSG